MGNDAQSVCVNCGQPVYRHRKAILGRRGPDRWSWVWDHSAFGECRDARPVDSAVELSRREAAAESAVLGGGL